MIDLVPVDEHDDVGVLLDGPRFTQVGVDRALVGPLFQRAVELRQRHHRTVEFLRQALQRAGNLRNLVGTVVTAGARDLHQLQVVDHDHADLAMLACQASGTRAHFRRRNTGGVVDEQLAIVEQVDRRGQPRPVVVAQLAGTHLGLVDASERRQHTNHDGVGGHLQRIDQNRLVRAQHGVFHQVHREGRLTHGGAPRDDDQVRRLQATGGLVEIGKAGGQPGDRLAGVEQRVDAIDGLDQDVIDTDGTTGLRPRLGDLEDHPLGFVEDFLAGPPLRRIGAVGDLVADAYQLTQGGALANDLRVGLDVGHRGRVLRQFAEIG